MNLWGGRFTKPTNQLVYDFNASIKFDKTFASQDIKGSIGHIKMLTKQEILTQEEGQLIEKTLKEILNELKTLTEILKQDIQLRSDELQLQIDKTANEKELYEIAKIEQEQQQLEIDAEKDMKSYQGNISWIASSAEFTPKIIQTKEERVNLVYAVKVKVKNDGSLKIGMPAEMWIK